MAGQVRPHGGLFYEMMTLGDVSIQLGIFEARFTYRIIFGPNNSPVCCLKSSGLEQLEALFTKIAGQLLRVQELAGKISRSFAVMFLPNGSG